VTDAVFSPENIRRILALADSADHLIIEATFLHEDLDRATRKYHLTARQAGFLARRAAAKRLSLFHYSPKYKGRGEALRLEAMEAFDGQGAEPVPSLPHSHYRGAGV